MKHEAPQNKLMIATMDAAVNLIQTYNSEPSRNAIRTRMKRIADDLVRAANEGKE